MKAKNARRTKRSWYKLSTKELDQELRKTTKKDREIAIPKSEPTNCFLWGPHSRKKQNDNFHILTAPNFSARWMRLIYGRGDRFTRPSCGLDIYLRNDGRVFARFYSPGKRVTYRSYELIGLDSFPIPEKGKLLGEDFVPKALRDLYRDWTDECIQYPDDVD